MWSTHRIQTLVNVAMIVLLLFGPGTFAPVKAQEPAPAAAGDAQPELLKDIFTANASSNPQDFFAIGDQVFYTAEDPVHGRELWVSDGTAGGTYMVEDINSIYVEDNRTDSSNPAHFVLFRGKLYFSAYTSPAAGQPGIWFSDGTPGGTDSAYQSQDGYFFQWLGVIGDWLYFMTSNGNFGRYGGTSDAVEWLNSDFRLYGSQSVTILNGSLYFSASSSTDPLGYELWRYDSAAGQASLVKDIQSGEGSSQPGIVMVVGSRLFFVATTAANGTELWVSDGTEGGTHLVKDITPGTESTSFWYSMQATAAGGWLYFAADDGVHGSGVWRSDGTEANTTLVADPAPGAASAFPRNLTTIGSEGSQTVFFLAKDGTAGAGYHWKLWAVPVTPAGTISSPFVLEVEPGTAVSMPDAFESDWYYTTFPVIGNTIYFPTYDAAGGFEVWESDGTPAGTVRTADGIPGPDSSAPTRLAVWGSRLVYSAIDAQHGREMWICDPAAGEAHMIADALTDVDDRGSSPSAGVVANVGGTNIRYFDAVDPLHGSELWRSDGTTAGTWMVKDIFPGPEWGTSRIGGEYSAVVDGILYFGGSDSDQEYLSVWRTDGTSEGTWKLQNPDPDQKYYGFNYMEAVGNTLFFMAFPESNSSYTQLWKSDGTPEGTKLLKRLVEVCGCTRAIYALGENVIFEEDRALWRSDGTAAGTQPFYSDYHGTLDSSLDAAVFGNKLYFQGPSVDESIEGILWMTDGTQAGTSHVQSGDGKAFREPMLFTQSGGDLYFVAQRYDEARIRQAAALWKIPAGGSTVNFVMDLISAVSGELQSSSPKYLAPISGGKWMFLDEDEYRYPMTTFMWFVADPTTGTSARLCPGFMCYPPYVSKAVTWQGKLYFAGGQLWRTDTISKSDGTAAGTTYLTVPGTTTRFNGGFGLLGTPNAFYFTANDGVHGAEPWVIRAKESKIYLPLVRK